MTEIPAIVLIAAFVIGIKALPGNVRHDSPYDYVSAVMNAFVFGLLIFAVDGLGHGAKSGRSGAISPRRECSLARLSSSQCSS